MNFFFSLQTQVNSLHVRKNNPVRPWESWTVTKRNKNQNRENSDVFQPIYLLFQNIRIMEETGNNGSWNAILCHDLVRTLSTNYTYEEFLLVGFPDHWLRTSYSTSPLRGHCWERGRERPGVPSWCCKSGFLS